MKTFDVWLDIMTYPAPGESLRVRKKFTQEAKNMHEAIELARAKHGGKLWLITETQESQARN